MSIEFSDVSGENIQILEERTLARWSISYSGGYVFTERQLSVDDCISVQLDGSGHISLGMMNRDPKNIRDFRELDKNNIVKQVTDLRVHRRSCDVSVTQKIEDGNRKTTFEYSGQRIVVKCSKNEAVWLVFCLRFGNVTAKIDSPNVKFHWSCGENIEFIDKKRIFAKLRLENPASLCCMHRHIYMNESVQFKVTSIKDGDRHPSKYYFVLGVSKIDAKQLSTHDPESFIVGVRAMSPYRWKMIKKFEKDECEGDLRVGVNSQGNLTYSHSSGISGEDVLDMEHNRVLIIFELFRTEISIKEFMMGHSYDYAESYDDVISVDQQNTDSGTEPVYLDLIPDPISTVPAAQMNKSPIPKRRTPVQKGRSPILKHKSMFNQSTGDEIIDPVSKDMEEKRLSIPTDYELIKPEIKPKPLGYKTSAETTLVSVPVNETEKTDMYWEVKEVPQKLKISQSVPVLKENAEENINKMNTVKELVERFANMGSNDETKKIPDSLPLKSDTQIPEQNTNVQSSTPEIAPEGASGNSAENQGELLQETFRSVNVLLNIGKQGNKEKKNKKKKK